MEIVVSNVKTSTMYCPHHRLSVPVLVQCIRIADAIRIQGTLPFLSLRVLECWYERKVHEHTAIDDLESFVWVLVWCILSINGSNTSREELQIEGLHSTNITTHIALKYGLLHALCRSARHGEAGPIVKIFAPFLQTCDDIIYRAASAMKQSLKRPVTIEESRTMTYTYFGEFLAAGAEYLAELPTSWPTGTIPVPS
jgi:hypothetical protein